MASPAIIIVTDLSYVDHDLPESSDTDIYGFTDCRSNPTSTKAARGASDSPKDNRLQNHGTMGLMNDVSERYAASTRFRNQ